MLVKSIPPLLSASAVKVDPERLQIVKDAIEVAQSKLFPSTTHPSGVMSAVEMQLPVFGLYARAIRDLSIADSKAGTRISREDYTFGTNCGNVSWILASGLFTPVRFEIPHSIKPEPLVDGFRFSQVGLNLLDSLEREPEMIRRFSREGMYNELQRMAKAGRHYLGSEFRLELTAPHGLLDAESGGVLRGKLVEIANAPRTSSFTHGSSIESPSLSLVLEVSRFAPGKFFQIRERWMDRLGLSARSHVVNAADLKQEYVRLDIDDVFLIEPTRHASIFDAEFTMSGEDAQVK
jgi:hypothetical protein